MKSPPQESPLAGGPGEENREREPKNDPKVATDSEPVKAVSIMDLVAVQRPDPKFITLHKGYVGLLIYPGGGEYPIDHPRMKTTKQVLWWVFHLSKKCNVTREHIRAFIEAAEKIKKGKP